MPQSKERADDPVRAYMKQMGQTELLTKEQEIEIFKTIEKSQRKAFNLLCKDNNTLIRFTELGRDVLAGRVKFEDFIDCDSKERFMKGLPKLVSTLEELDHTDVKRKTLYKRFQLKQSVIENWCDELAQRGNESMTKTLRSLRVAKDEMVKANLRLVVANAKKYTNRGVALLDLVQEGNLGLIRAVEKFEYKRGYKFSTYATWWVRQGITKCVGETGRTIRVPMHMIDTINKIFRVQRTLLQSGGCEPSAEEIAHELKMPATRVKAILKIAMHPISLDAPVGDSGNTTIADFIEDEREYNTDSSSDAAFEVLKDNLTFTLSSLTNREVDVLKMRFGMNDGIKRTLEEVGDTYTVTRERIRQIEAKAIRKLLNMITDHKA